MVEYIRLVNALGARLIWVVSGLAPGRGFAAVVRVRFLSTTLATTQQRSKVTLRPKDRQPLL